MTTLTAKRTILTAVLLMFLLAGGGPAFPLDLAAVGGYTEKIPTGLVNWGEGYAEVQVVATYDTVRHGASHAKIRAVQDAEKRAEEAFYRLLRGVNVTGAVRVAGTPQLEEALRKAIKAHMKMTDQKTANVTMNATFRIPLHGKKSVSGALRSAISIALQPGALAGTPAGPYSSVIFDATGTPLQAALFPKVVGASGELLYGPGDPDPKWLEKGAPVVFLAPATGDALMKGSAAKDLATQVGANPITIKVGKPVGDFLADIELSAEEEARLREAQVGPLLSSGRIIILQHSSIDVSKQ